MPISEPAPCVSIIVPAYEASAFIAEALQSVFTQTFQDFEVLVVNDGSPDTPTFERVLAPFSHRITYVKQPNSGPSGARNHGIRLSRGKYLAFLDSDDVWMPGFLQEQIAVLESRPDVDAVYCDGINFGLPEYAGRTLMSLTPSHGEVTFEALVHERCTVLTSSTVARKPAVVDAGLFDERFRRSEDFHLWLRMAFRGAHFAYTASQLVRHRRRQGSLAHNTTAMMLAFGDVLRDIDRSLPLTARQRRLVRQKIAARESDIALFEGKRLFLAQRYDAARSAIWFAAALQPDWLQRLRLRTIALAMRLAPSLVHTLYCIRRGGSDAQSNTTRAHISRLAKAAARNAMPPRIRSGLRQALELAPALVRQEVFVFELQPDQASEPAAPLAVRLFSKGDRAPAGLPYTPSECAAYFDDGWTLAVLFRDETPVSFAWTRVAAAHHVTEVCAAVATPSTAGWIVQCETPVEHRGHGYYPMLISAVAARCPAERCYIYCVAANIASRRGIEKAGFRRIATIRRRLGWISVDARFADVTSRVWPPVANTCGGRL